MTCFFEIIFLKASMLNQATKITSSINKVKHLHLFRTPILKQPGQIKPYFSNLHLQNVSWVREKGTVDKMVVFKAKIWLMQKRRTTTKKDGGGEKREGKKGRSDALWSRAEWAARPVAGFNSCARNNKWCIHELRKQRLFRGCKVCTRNDERPTFLLFQC